MPEIRVLPRHLVNKIAAGEVIERPASVVKELVENALDAGAAAIDVTVEDGGRRLVQVRDDGTGMGPDDLALAFAPHATSKLAGEDDLFRIHTLGFRGEALASISSVSHAVIVSRRRESTEASAFEVRAEGDSITAVKPVAAPEGTMVSVRDLFYNTPGRRKFLRSADTEFGHIVEQLARLALPACRVTFRLTHTNRLTHNLPAGPLRQRVSDLFGPDLGEALIEFASPERGLKVSGLIGPPAAARASGRWQYFFVNGRYVRDKFLTHAVREAYHGLLEASRWPVAFVFLEIDPAEVDVNVHPTKLEVRFRNSQLVHSQVAAAIREALKAADLSSPVSLGAGNLDPALTGDVGGSQGGAGGPDDARRQSLKQAMADFFRSQPPPQRGPALEPSRPQGADRGGHAPAPAAPSGQERDPFYDPFAELRAPPTVEQSGPSTQSPELGEAMAASSEIPVTGYGLRASVGRALQVHNSYIVIATETGVAIIDQHALHERILFEELRGRLAAGRLESQHLLIPQTVEVGQADKALLAQQAELLDRLGLEVTEFGPSTVAVHRFPSLLAGRNVPVAELLRDLLDLLAEPATPDAGGLLDRVLSTMACKAAVKAGDPLTDMEIEALLSRRAAVERSAACPHGRPTTLTLTLDELERQFKRT